MWEVFERIQGIFFGKNPVLTFRIVSVNNVFMHDVDLPPTNAGSKIMNMSISTNRTGK